MTDKEKIEKIREHVTKRENFFYDSLEKYEVGSMGSLQCTMQAASFQEVRYLIEDLDETESEIDIQDAISAIRKELMKKSSLYSGFLASLASGIKDCIVANSKRNEHGVYKVEFNAGDLALAGLNRVIGFEETEGEQ